MSQSGGSVSATEPYENTDATGGSRVFICAIEDRPPMPDDVCSLCGGGKHREACR